MLGQCRGHGFRVRMGLGDDDGCHDLSPAFIGQTDDRDVLDAVVVEQTLRHLGRRDVLPTSIAMISSFRRPVMVRYPSRPCCLGRSAAATVGMAPRVVSARIPVVAQHLLVAARADLPPYADLDGKSGSSGSAMRHSTCGSGLPIVVAMSSAESPRRVAVSGALTSVWPYTLHTAPSKAAPRPNHLREPRIAHQNGGQRGLSGILRGVTLDRRASRAQRAKPTTRVRDGSG